MSGLIRRSITENVTHQDNADSKKNNVFGILRERVKLTQYTGYNPDGSVDVTPEILKAISRIGARGGVIQCAAGLYRQSLNIIVPPGVTIEGEGPKSTVFSVAGDGYNAFSLIGEGSSMIGVGFNTATNAPRASGAFISLPAGGFANKIKNFAMSNAYRGISLDGASVITVIEDGTISDTTPATGICIFINGGNDTFISRVVADNANASQPHAGLYIRKSEAVWCDSSDFLHCGRPLVMAPEAGEFVSWCFFDKTAFDSSSDNGIHMTAGDGALIKGVNFQQCWTSTVQGSGVSLLATGTGAIDGTTFEGHRSLNNGKSGYLLVGPGVVNTQFDTCIAAGNSQKEYFVYSGFDVGAGVRLFSIQGCTSGAALNFAPSQQRGILVNPGNSDAYIITGNKLGGNQVPLLDLGTGSDKLVNNNFGYKTQSKGVATIPAGANSVTVPHTLAGMPLVVNATPSNVNLAGKSYWTGAYSSQNFMLYVSANVSTDTLFNWTAEMPFN